LVRFELLAGVRDREVDALERFFAALSLIAVDEDIARVGGAVLFPPPRGQTRSDDADYVIAATAIVLDAELLTTDVRRFPMLDGLRAAY
jgi:predicted nucleic acid-binding protein